MCVPYIYEFRSNKHQLDFPSFDFFILKMLLSIYKFVKTFKNSAPDFMWSKSRWLLGYVILRYLSFTYTNEIFEIAAVIVIYVSHVWHDTLAPCLKPSYIVSPDLILFHSLFDQVNTIREINILEKLKSACILEKR